jgi:hypothetical protein
MQDNIGRVEVGEDGELYLISKVIDQMGWDEGTLLEWIDNDDGTYTVKEVDDTAA